MTRAPIIALRGVSVVARRATGLNATGAALVVLAGGLWLLGRLIAGRPLFLLAYGTVTILVLGWFLAGRRLGLSAQRSGLVERANEGDVLEVAVRLDARRRVPSVVVEERVPEELGRPVLVPFEAIPRGQTSFTYPLRCWRRGAFQVGPMVVRYGDPVGLFSRERIISAPFEVLVHPRLAAIRDRPLTRQFEDPPLRPRVSKPWPTGLEFYGMREHRPGDDLRRIVWRAVARTGRLLVRDAEQGISDRVILAVNTSHDAYPGGEPYSSGFETAISVTAALGVHHLGEGYGVVTESNAGPVTKPLRGPEARIPLLDALARLERGPQPLADMIGRLVRARQSNAHTVLVTPRLDRSEAAQLQTILQTGASLLAVIVKYGDRYEEAAHNAAAAGCQVIEASPAGALASEIATELGGRHAVSSP